MAKPERFTVVTLPRPPSIGHAMKLMSGGIRLHFLPTVVREREKEICCCVGFVKTRVGFEKNTTHVPAVLTYSLETGKGFIEYP